MDLRTKRTLKSLKEAYIHLVKTKDISKIKVVDVCEIAMIHKATFYNYYEDIEHLRNTVNLEVIEEMLESINYKEITIFTNPKLFVHNFLNLIDEKHSLIMTLYHNNPSFAMFVIEEKLRNALIPTNASIDTELKAIYLLGGMIHTLGYLKSKKIYTNEVIANMICKFIDQYKSK